MLSPFYPQLVDVKRRDVPLPTIGLCGKGCMFSFKYLPLSLFHTFLLLSKTAVGVLKSSRGRTATLCRGSFGASSILKPLFSYYFQRYVSHFCLFLLFRICISFYGKMWFGGGEICFPPFYFHTFSSLEGGYHPDFSLSSSSTVHQRLHCARNHRRVPSSLLFFFLFLFCFVLSFLTFIFPSL